MVCDQCYIKHRKCSRELPICSRCKETGLKCTWSRNEARLNKSINDQMILSKKGSVSGINQKETSKRKKAKQSYVENLNTTSHKNRVKKSESSIDQQLNFNHNELGSKSLSLIKFYNYIKLREWALKKWRCETEFQIALGMICKFYGSPITSAKNNKTLFKMVLIVKKSIDSDIQTAEVKITKNIIKYGVLRYFQYMNSIYPLFTFKNFIRKKSFILNLAVACSGLNNYPASKLRDEAIKRLEDELDSKLSLTNIKYSLETVQAILSYAIGINLSSKFSKLYNYLRIASLILRSLGAHLNPPKGISSEYLNELELARSTLWKFDHLFFYPETYYFNEIHIDNMICFTKRYFSGSYSNLFYKRSFTFLISNPEHVVFDHFQEKLYIIYGQTNLYSTCILKKVALEFVKNTECFYQVRINCVATYEQKLISFVNYNLNKISKLCKMYSSRFNYVKGNNVTRFTLLCMQIWCSTALRVSHDIVSISDFIPYPKVDDPPFILHLYFKSTQSILVYVEYIIGIFDRINTRQFFLHTANTFVVIGRILIKQIYLYSHAKYCIKPPLETYKAYFIQVYSRLVSLKQKRLYQAYATIYVNMLNTFVDSYSMNDLLSYQIPAH